MFYQVFQSGDRIDLDLLYQGGFFGVRLGDEDRGIALVPGHRHHGQDSFGVAQGAVQGKLSKEHGPGGDRVDLS